MVANMHKCCYGRGTRYYNIYHFFVSLWLQFMQNDEVVLLQTVPSLKLVTSVDNDDVLITLEGNECVAIFKKLNFGVKFTWMAAGMDSYLCYELTDVTRELCMNAYGHMGNCDLNPDNDKAGPDDCKYYQ